MGSWRTYRIGDLAEVYDGPHATPVKTSHGPWYLSVSSLSNGRLDLSASAHLSEEDFVRWTRRVRPQAGDVLFSYETRLGAAALMPDGLVACLGRRMGLLRPRPDRVDPRFLLYAYLGDEFQATIRGRAVRGATVDRIPLLELPEWPITVPVDLSEQRAIAAVLGALDDKLTMTERVAATCHELGLALYRRVAREAKRTGALGAILDLRYGRALPAGARTAGDVPVYGSAGVVGTHTEPLVAGPGIVVGRKGTVGAVHWSSTSFFPIDTTFYVAPRQDFPMEFLYYTLVDLRLDTLDFDSAVPGLSRADALARRVPLPDPAALARFTAQVRPLFDRITAARRERSALATLRDTLLPRLVSGALRVDRHRSDPAALRPT